MSEGAGVMEFASEGRTFGAFPAEWGVPPGKQFSEERAAWVRERVAECQALAAVRRRAQEQARAAGSVKPAARMTPTPQQVQVELLRRRSV
ncbi:hypothetical protein [Streptomyces sp. NPDC059909]|uniref:hypothetical protein n=1 Tax=Streptomyces sp. NPDC059909 TaxID=3346998 RepID=UPI003654AF89